MSLTSSSSLQIFINRVCLSVCLSACLSVVSFVNFSQGYAVEITIIKQYAAN